MARVTKAPSRKKETPPPPTTTPLVPSKRIDLGIALLLALATLAAYWQVHTHEFINFDDLYYVSNPHVIHGLTAEGFQWAIRPTKSPSFWFPLTLLSHMLDRQLFGDRSGLHHLMSVGIHLSSSVLLFFVLKRATGARWRSAFVAFVFALHPLHVESVAWAAERKDVLSALFWMLTLWAYLDYVEKPGPVRYLVMTLMFVCALMSKAMVVTLPFVLLLLDVWPLRRAVKPSRLVIEKLPLVGLSIAASWITFIAQRAGGAVQTTGQLSLASRVGNALISYIAYLVSFVWPLNLAVFYPYEPNPAWEVAAAGIALALITMLVLRARHDRYLAVGWLWYLGTLVPVIGLIQVGDQARADRFTYIPMIGISIMAAWGAVALFEPSAWKKTPWSKTVLAIISAAVCAAWFVITFIDVGYWQDSATLFRHALEVTKDNYIAYDRLGAALRKEGRIDDAIPDFKNAVAIRPLFEEAQLNLGEALLSTGRVDQALPHLLDAVRLPPESVYAHIDLGTALNLKGQTPEAEAQYLQALRLDPGVAQAHEGLGVVRIAAGRPREALPELEEAVRLDPEDGMGHDNLGRALMTLQRTGEAVAQFSQAIRLQPDSAGAHFNLGTALASQGRTAEALQEFQAVLKLKPGYVNAHYNAGIALGQLHRYREAVAEFAEALRLKPDFSSARQNVEYYSTLAGKPGK